MNQPLKTSHSLPNHERLLAVVLPVLRAHRAEVVDVELKTEAGGWVLRVFVEKEGSAEKLASTRDAAIDLELCSGISRDLSPALDVADLIPFRYTLEVSSPGVERPLKTARDFARFSGQKAKLKLSSPAAGQHVLRGAIDRKSDEIVTVTQDGKLYEVPLADVQSAHLVFEFGPAPKPGGPKKKHPKQK